MSDRETLLTFLMAWYYWAMGNENKEFTGSVGLFSNLDRFFIKESHIDYLDVGQLLRTRLEMDFGWTQTPFNTIESYNEAIQKRSHHKNPQRLRWVEKTILQLQSELQAGNHYG